MLLIYLTAAWLLGIFLARFLWAQGVMGCACPPTWGWAVLLLIFLTAAILVRRRQRSRLAALLLLFALLGAWRYQTRPFEPCFTPDDLAFYNGSDDEPAWVTVEGIILWPMTLHVTNRLAWVDAKFARLMLSVDPMGQ